ncbi:hypothetical protein Tco_0792379 [Tanacetum coccineum]
MSNTNNNNMKTQTSSALYNAIMEAGGKDRPPMLAPDANATPVTPDIQKWITTEAEAVQIVLTRIDNNIYSTVDSCPNATEMWKAIKRLKQGESINVQDLETNLYWEFRKFTSQKEPEVVADDDSSSKEKEIDKLMALISMSFKKIYKPTNNNLRTLSNTRNTNIDNTPRTNRGTGENVGTQVMQQTGILQLKVWACSKGMSKAKKAKGFILSQRKDDVVQELEAHYMYMAKIQEVTPNTTDNSGPIFDAEPLEKPLQKVHNSDDDYNVFANERQHPKQPESVNDTYLVEQGDPNITHDLSDMSNNGEEADQDDQMLQKERKLLASLIDQMKIKIYANKQNNKALKSSNKALREANTFLNTELKRYQDTDFVKNAREKFATAYGLLEKHKVKSKKSSSAYSTKILSWNKRLSEMENELSAYKRTISIISFQKDEQEKQCQEQIDNDKVWKQKESSSFPELNVKFFEIQYLKAQLQDKDIAISDLKKLIEKMKGKYVETNTREPKRKENQSVATPHKKIVASEPTIKKSKSTFRKLYEHVSKICSWWYPKLTPPEYKWKPKSKTGNVKLNISLPLGTESSTANILEPKTVRSSILSNTPLYSNSFAPRRDNPIHC